MADDIFEKIYFELVQGRQELIAAFKASDEKAAAKNKEQKTKPVEKGSPMNNRDLDAFKNFIKKIGGSNRFTDLALTAASGATAFNTRHVAKSLNGSGLNGNANGKPKPSSGVKTPMFGPKPKPKKSSQNGQPIKAETASFSREVLSIFSDLFKSIAKDLNSLWTGITKGFKSGYAKSKTPPTTSKINVPPIPKNKPDYFIRTKPPVTSKRSVGTPPPVPQGLAASFTKSLTDFFKVTVSNVKASVDGIFGGAKAAFGLGGKKTASGNGGRVTSADLAKPKDDVLAARAAKKKASPQGFAEGLKDATIGIMQFGVQLFKMLPLWGKALVVVGLFVGLGVAIAKATDAFLEAQKVLAKYNGQLAGAFAIANVKDIQRNIKMGQLTAPGTSRLVQANSAFKDSLVPLRVMLTNLTSAVLLPLIRILTGIMNFLAPLFNAINWVSEQLSKIFGLGMQPQPTQLLPVQQQLINFGQGKLPREKRFEKRERQ